MLRDRVITGVIMALVMLGAVLFLPTFWLGLVLLPVLGVAAWEWSALVGMEDSGRRWLYALLVPAVALALGWRMDAPGLRYLVLLAALLFWLWNLFRLRRYAQEREPVTRPASGALQGLLLLVPTWVALLGLHGGAQGPLPLILLLVLVAVADTAAYFSGRRFGRRKLAPRISPGKTVEGAMGAAAATVVVALVSLAFLEVAVKQPVVWVLACLLTVAASVCGDLFESMIKRQRGVKDSGTILPGHGGVMDRIDSLTAAGPLFCLFLIWMSR
jgi:phosphatidate cytidylyltransferase